MSCKHHPNVEAIASCARCNVAMCSVCAEFLDGGVFCERCAQAQEAEKYVAAQTDQLNRKARVATGVPIQSKISEPTDANNSEGEQLRFLLLSGGFIGLCTVLLIYSNPTLFEFDSEAEQERIAEQALEDCRLVFEEIGVLLENGQTPDSSLRCVESDTVNIIRSEGDTVTVLHPNPYVHGFSQIYVSNESHEPVFVE